MSDPTQPVTDYAETASRDSWGTLTVTASGVLAPGADRAQALERLRRAARLLFKDRIGHGREADVTEREEGGRLTVTARG